MKRYYIAVEGIDGSGKTTTIKFLQEKYSNQLDVYKRTYKPDWIKPLVGSSIFKNVHCLQVLIYLYLAHYNYWSFKKNDNGRPIVIMDRCFFSNICYFFPSALENKILRGLLIKLEPHIKPDIIFVLDAEPEVAWKRDCCRKDLNWLRRTREYYLKATQLKEYQVEMIAPMKNIEGPYLYIERILDKLLRDNI